MVAMPMAMLDHFEIIKLLQSIIHNWKGLLLRYIMPSCYLLYGSMLISFHVREL